MNLTDLEAAAISDAPTLRAAREHLVREHMEDENRLAFDKVLATFPHPHYELIPGGKVFDGPAEVNAYYQRSRRLFPDQRNEVLSLRHADEAVVVEFWLRGTHTGTDGGVKPTGASFQTRMTAFFIFEAGSTLLRCERVYFDAMDIARQLFGRPRLTQPSSWVRAWRTLKLLKQQAG